MPPDVLLPVTAGDSRPAAAVAVVEHCIQLDAGYLQALRQAVR